MNVSLTIDDGGAQALLSRAPGRVQVALRGAVEDGTTFMLARVRRYPPQRRNSTYIRTNTLQKSWSRRITVTAGDVVGTVGSNGNMAPYNRVVMDREQQAAVHRGRWPTAQGLVQYHRRDIQRMFEDRLRAAGIGPP